MHEQNGGVMIDGTYWNTENPEQNIRISNVVFHMVLLVEQETSYSYNVVTKDTKGNQQKLCIS
jgi:hypothetical protein